MIAQLREKAKELDQRGAQVLVVEPNDTYRIRYLVRRAQEDAGRRRRPVDEFTQGAGLWLPNHGEFPWPVVTDPGSTAGASYGVAFRGRLYSGELCSRPNTYVIDREGVLRYVHDYKSTDLFSADEIIQLLDDLEEKRRLAAGLAKTEADLRLAFESPELDVRAGAAAAVYRMEEPAAAFVPALAKGLGDDSLRFRRLCAESLGRTGPAAKDAAPALLRALVDADRKVRWVWNWTLRAPRPQPQAILSTMAYELKVYEEDLRVRAAVIAALVAIGSGTVPELLGALESRRAEVRFSAAEVLGRFADDGERIVPALVRVLDGDGDPTVREAAIHSLNRLGRYDRALVSALRDPDAGVRTAAAEAIERTGGCGEWEAVIALVETLDDVDAQVRDRAYYALTHRSDASIPTLKAKLEDPDLQVRARAAAALQRIDPTSEKEEPTGRRR